MKRTFKTRKIVFGSSCFLLALSLLAGSAAAQESSPPQPAKGPGGADYAHKEVTVRTYGEAGGQYWIFLPDEPKPESAPVVIFMHGWGGTQPVIYGAWIKHLARKGNIVIYPRFQENLRTPTREMMPNALEAIKDAWKRLESGQEGVKPAAGQLAFVGHSLGGFMAPNLAAIVPEHGLPAPKAIMVAHPGNGSPWIRREETLLKLENLDRIPRDTLLVAVTGDRDRIVADRGIRAIFAETRHIPRENKAMITIASDERATPPLLANHGAPCSFEPGFLAGQRVGRQPMLEDAEDGPDEGQPRGRRPRLRDRDSGEDTARPGAGRRLLRDRDADQDRPVRPRERLRERLEERREAGPGAERERPAGRFAGRLAGEGRELPRPDALAYYGYWKLCDAMLDTAFHGRNREYVFGDGEEVRFMGRHADGRPVPPLVVNPVP